MHSGIQHLLLSAAILLAGPCIARDQVATEIDALTASPANFNLLLENEHVRVLEYVLLPGKQDNWHTHPPKVSYVLTGGAAARGATTSRNHGAPLRNHLVQSRRHYVVHGTDGRRHRARYSIQGVAPPVRVCRGALPRRSCSYAMDVEHSWPQPIPTRYRGLCRHVSIPDRARAI